MKLICGVGILQLVSSSGSRWKHCGINTFSHLCVIWSLHIYVVYSGLKSEIEVQ